MRLDPVSVRQEPVVFGGCRGALHLPAGGEARGAIVLCQPLGRDARSAYRPLWLAAREMAAKGFAVLRYDHPGQGDSAPLPPDVDAWPHWIDAAVEAARFLREQTGASRLVMAGLRIGASIAACAAKEAGANSLVLWAPVLTGAAWLKELRFVASISNPRRRERSDGGLEADGLFLSAETVRSLAALRLEELDAAAPQILIASTGHTAPLVARYRADGAAVTVAEFKGAEELFRDSYANAPPLGLFQTTLAWLLDQARDWLFETFPGRALCAALSLPEAEEQAAEFGDGLRGVLCLPRRGAVGRRAVVFVNTGGDSRAGAGGFTMRAARRLAARGIASLRFDFAGLGESDFAADWRSHIYDTDRVGEFRAAIDLLVQRGYDDFIAVGVCSGAYHSVRAAVAEPRISAVFAVNPAYWVWRKGGSLITPGRDEVASTRALLRRAARLLLDPDAWANAAGRQSGRVAVAALRDRLIRNLGLAWRDGRQTRRLRGELADLARRGGRLKLQISLNDLALDRLELHFGRRGRWLRRHGFETSFERNLDHGLTLAESQEQVLEALLAFSAPPAKPRRPSSLLDNIG